MSNYCFYEEHIYIYIYIQREREREREREKEEDMTKVKNGKSVEICLSASFRGY